MAIRQWLRRFREMAVSRTQLLAGLLLGFLIVAGMSAGMHYTSTSRFCVSCHVHPRADSTWTMSSHYKNKSGVVVHCHECHLPPSGLYRVTEKARMGLRDVAGMIFKDTDKIDWDERAALYNARHYTYDSACMRCHADLYSLGLSQKGIEAHQHYEKTVGEVNCINCHKAVGHYREEAILVASDSLPQRERPMRRHSGEGSLRSYTETIPGTEVTFEMVAVPGGVFLMGSPEDEPFRNRDEGPRHEVSLSPFWIGETEVTWNEFQAYFNEMGRPAAKDTVSGYLADTSGVDGISGPTPKYGSLATGGWEAAYSMTHHAAMKYCEWLSDKTGKRYRLPTEAEWEYCARAGTSGPYFFDADPSRLTSKRLWNRLFGIEDGVINRYVFYDRNSRGQVQNPYTSEPNPWGLYDMLGNVKEFCLDYYAPDAYYRAYKGSVLSTAPVVDPAGPLTGREHVVRGGSFLSDPVDCRVAARSRTDDDGWRVTDPNNPKSIWWYSDCMDVGFRVVRELDPEEHSGEGTGSE